MQDGSRQVEFPFSGRRKIRAAFDAEPISSDGGLVLLSRVDRALGLIASVGRQLPRWRDDRYVEHADEELLRQRVFQIAAGYEDCNDANTLRRDPVLKASCGRDPLDGDLASQPTLSRLENAIGAKSCYRIGQALLESYVARHPKRPSRIVIDLDTTDDPLHGQQELRFFNAYYNEYVYMPLLIFDQDGDLMTAVLQSGRPEGGRPVAAVLKRIIRRLRRAWPGIPILVRGDSGFASPEIYRRCHAEKVDILLGFQPNKLLGKLSANLAEKARRHYLRTGNKARLFKAIRYRGARRCNKRRWPRSYRMIIKAEHMEQGSNVRYVITNLSGNPAALYDRYVQRGESSENSIKDLKRALKADRLSCHRFWPNQFRLLLHATAYVLMYMLRRAARGTELAVAQMDTLRLRLLKVGAQVQSTARRVWLHLASSHPWTKVWLLVARRLLGPRAFA